MNSNGSYVGLIIDVAIFLWPAWVLMLIAVPWYFWHKRNYR